MDVYVWSDYFHDYTERMQAMADNAQYAFECAESMTLVKMYYIESI